MGIYNYYNVEASGSSLLFEFFSEGSNGKIKKQVTFEPVKEHPLVYNLSFGDVSPNGEINYTITSNNGDSQKVLATVALAVLKFHKEYPDHWIYVTGTTKSRTRLYRMVITNNWEEIKGKFYVFGLQNEVLELFEKGREYEAFLIKKK